MAFTAGARYHVARSQFYTRSPNERDDTFFLKNGLELLVRSGDITQVEAAVVVVGEDAEFSGGGAIARALIRAGGWEYQQNRDRLRKFVTETHSEEFVYGCPGGSKLKFRQVFHALTLFGKGQKIPCWQSHMKLLFFQIGLHAENNKFETVATPLLGTGAAGGPMDESLEAVVDGLSLVSLNNLHKVILVEYDGKKALDMKEKLRQILDRKMKETEEEAERVEHSKGCRIPGKGPYEASAARSTGTEEGWNDQQDSNQISGQEAWPRHRVTEDGRRCGAIYGGPPNLDLLNSTSNDRSRREDHSYQVVSLAGAQGPNDAKTQKGIYGRVDPKIINSIINTTTLIESGSQHNSPDTQRETDFRDGGLRRNSTSSRTTSTTGERTPADEVTHQGGRRAMNREVPRQGFGDQAESKKDPESFYEKVGEWADSSRNKNSSPHDERESERGDGFHQDKESFRGNDETSSEKGDKDKYTNFIVSSPRNGQNGRDERKFSQRRSSSSKVDLTKCDASPKIVHMSSDADVKGEGEDKDEDKELSSASDQGGHAPGEQPTGNNHKSGDFWRDPPDWCYVNEEGNSTAYLDPNRDVQDLNPDRASYRGMQDYGADNSFQHFSRSEFDASSSIEILPMPSRSSDFSSFADPTSGSVHQAIPSSQDEAKPLPHSEGTKKEPMAENQGPVTAGGNANKGTNDNYRGEMKRIFRLHTTADKSGECKEVLAQEMRAKSLEEGEDKLPDPANRGQRKSKSCTDGRLQAPDSLQDERPPTTTSPGTDHDANSHCRGQRKSKAQVPREDATVSHQRSPSSPDPDLDRGLPVGHTEDISTAEAHMEHQDQTRGTAADTQPSAQDPGTESANRGQRKGKRATADGNTGSDSVTAKFSERETRKRIVGTMPRGRMNYSVQPGIHVPGYEGCGVIFADYIIPDGIQASEHPKPGSPYCGCSERAILPDNDEGRRVLKLLEEAFDRRLTFQVCEQPGGQALVEWADIPHKTCLRGTKDRGGYPDPDYLGSVQDLLREKYGLE